MQKRPLWNDWRITAAFWAKNSATGYDEGYLRIYFCYPRSLYSDLSLALAQAQKDAQAIAKSNGAADSFLLTVSRTHKANT